jgi:hypothetical protein
MRPLTRKWLAMVPVLLMPAAFFYLFVVPMMVAADPQPGVGGYVAVAFGAFLLLQVWLLIGLWALESLEGLYDMRIKGLLRIRRLLTAGLGPDREHDVAAAPVRAIVSGLLSFLLTTYAFGVLYLFVSQRDEDSFGVGALGVVDAIYYGFATAVTYGDLDPLSNLARVAVLMQLAVTLGYTLFLFSVLAGVIQAVARSTR